VEERIVEREMYDTGQGERVGSRQGWTAAAFDLLCLISCFIFNVFAHYSVQTITLSFFS
jgi:hypothetical protein